MPKYEIIAPDGKTLVVEGSKPPTQEDAKRIFSQYQVQRQTSTGEKIGGAVDVGLNMLTSAAAKPLSGLYGLATLATTFDPQRAAATQSQAEQVLTYPLQPGSTGERYAQAIGEAPVIKQIGEVFESGSQQLGDAAYNVTGSPAVGAVVKAAPEAFATYLGAKAPAGQAAKFEAKSAEIAKQGASEAVRNSAMNAVNSDTAIALRSGKQKSIAEVIDADPDYYNALEELGVTAEPLASYASRNPQFRGVEQALAAMPNSPQYDQALEFSKQVSAIAHGLQEKYTRFESAPEASIVWREAATKTIDELSDAAEQAYKMVDDKVDKRAIAKPTKTVEFLQEATKDLAGGIDDPDLPTSLKTVLKSLEPRRITAPDGTVTLMPPTYANLDLVRKDIGAGLRKEGAFKDEQKGILKKLYSTLTDDLHAMAEEQGLVDEVKASKALVKQRKDLETSMQALIGKQLDKDIIPVIQGGASGLARGGLEKWKRTMQSLDPEMRQELVFTAISDQFRKTLGGLKDQQDATAFLKWYDKTLGNKTVRGIIEQDLPEGSLKDMDNLAKISRGMAQAKAQKISTGIVNAILKDQPGFLEKMMGKASSIPGVTGRTISVVEDLLSKKTDRAKQTSQLLADPQFQSFMRSAVANGVYEGRKLEKAAKASEQRLMQSAKFKAWADTLSESDRAKLFGAGFAQFLIGSEQEQEPPK